MPSDPSVQEDFDELADFLYGEAERLLGKYGEFYPIGSTLPIDGEADHVIVGNGEERPASQDLIDLFVEAFRKDAAAGKIRAAGIAYDILTRATKSDVPIDAIAVKLEHVSGHSVLWVYPYKLINGEVAFEKGFAQDSEPQIFS